MKDIRPYHLHNQYEALVAKTKQCAPLGLTEVWGRVKFEDIADFRLNLGKFRMIELAPMTTRIGVFMEWRKVFRQPDMYSKDQNFLSFEDAFGYLRVNENWNQPWNVYPETELSDPYVEIFLTSGMKLIVKGIKMRHPISRSIRLRQ